jgi:crossover junction endodeoxyribonuclease RuvC
LIATTHPRRILGIDPGLRVTGFGLIVQEGNMLTYVTSGCIRASGDSLPVRLGIIARDLAHVIAEHSPAEVVVERVFVNVNPASTLALGQARGAAIAAAVLAGLPVHEYTAGQIKQAVVGGGRAAKAQVQSMVSRLLELPGLPSPDAADMREVMAYQYTAARKAGLAVGILPNIKVSLVVQPEEGRELQAERSWLDPYEWKLKALRTLARPYAAWKKRPVPSAKEFRAEIPAAADGGN